MVSKGARKAKKKKSLREKVASIQHVNEVSASILRNSRLGQLNGSHQTEDTLEPIDIKVHMNQMYLYKTLPAISKYRCLSEKCQLGDSEGLPEAAHMKVCNKMVMCQLCHVATHRTWSYGGHKKCHAIPKNKRSIPKLPNKLFKPKRSDEWLCHFCCKSFASLGRKQQHLQEKDSKCRGQYQTCTYCEYECLTYSLL